jgi:hypothetical protein
VRQRVRWTLLVVGVLVLCGSCRLRLDVDVTLHDDGSGVVAVVVAVDPDGLAKVGGDLAAVVDLERLRGDGWSIDGPTRTDGGDTTLRFEQPFDTPKEGEALLASLSGEDGPLGDFRLDRSSSFWRDRWTFRGTADFSKGAGSPAVDDEAVGQLADRLGASLDRLIQVRVRVRLPGDVSSNATTQADNGAVWDIGLGDGPVELSASGSRAKPWSFVLVGAGGLVALVILVTLLVRLAMLRTDGRR